MMLIDEQHFFLFRIPDLSNRPEEGFSENILRVS